MVPVPGRVACGRRLADLPRVVRNVHLTRRPVVITNLPGQYAKFITALAGNAVAYLTVYGGTWHLQPALVLLGAALAVLGVPNAAPPPAPAPAKQPSNVTITPP